jgi:ABC-2 type transport system ATP-binding protein
MSAVIETDDLTKRYGEARGIENVTMTVEAGEVFGFLGPNGAGKTTTIRLLLGLHRPSAGRAELFGVDAWGDPITAHRRVAYVAGEPMLWPSLTGAETLAFLARLSKGNRQKVQLIAAFASRADLLLLDEPTSGLDPLMEVAFRETVHEAQQHGQTVFLSSHILSEVEALCDRVGILREGRLVEQGTLEELRHLSAQTVEITFSGPAPTLPDLPGVRVTSAGGNALRAEVTGSIGPLIEALSDHPVVSLISREPSLEEIFLHHYDSEDRHVTY